MSSSPATGSPGIIDFYFACNDLLAYDLAICLNAWCFEPDGSLQPHQGAAPCCRATAAAGRSSQAEIAALPVLARGSALRFLLTRLYDWLHQVEGALVKPKDPREYLREAALPPATSTGPRAMAWPDAGQPSVVEIHTDGACSGNPGPGRLGCDPELARARAASSPAASRSPPTTAWS